MSRRAPYAVLVALVVGSLAVLTPGPAHAGGPGHWTMIAKVDNGFDYPGIFRTSNGTLHVVWRKHPNGKYEYDYSTVGLNGAFLGSGKVLGPWEGLEEDPVLVAGKELGHAPRHRLRTAGPAVCPRRITAGARTSGITIAWKPTTASSS